MLALLAVLAVAPKLALGNGDTAEHRSQRLCAALAAWATRDDLVVALATDGPAAWEVTTVIQQFDEASGAIVDIDGPALLDAMQGAHARHVEPLD